LQIHSSDHPVPTESESASRGSSAHAVAQPSRPPPVRPYRHHPHCVIGGGQGRDGPVDRRMYTEKTQGHPHHQFRRQHRGDRSAHDPSSESAPKGKLLEHSAKPPLCRALDAHRARLLEPHIARLQRVEDSTALIHHLHPQLRRPRTCDNLHAHAETDRAAGGGVALSGCRKPISTKRAGDAIRHPSRSHRVQPEAAENPASTFHRDGRRGRFTSIDVKQRLAVFPGAPLFLAQAAPLKPTPH